MSVMPLPRSLDPLPDESLPGFVLRLAHRLDMSPTRLAVVTGLDRGRRQSSVASSVIFALAPQVTAAFAHATRLTTAEVTDLTLASLASRYPPLDLQSISRRRQVHGVFIRENWIFARSTRYCSQCLAGDGSVIQQRHGGAWSKLWRLPVVFACPIHRRLLRHLCPGCHAPVHQRRAGSPQLLPLAAHPVVHPAVCRNPTTPKAPYQPCGHRLDQTLDVGAEPRPVGDELLRLQQRLLALLGPEAPGEVFSVGQPTAPARYFVDLRIMTALLQASWPLARDLAGPTDADHVRHHVRHHVQRAREQIAAAEAVGRKVLHMHVYDKPPLDASATAALLGAADRLLTSGEATTRRALRDMFDAAPFAREWTRRFLAGDGRCSPGLHTAAGTETRTPHVIRRLGLPPRPTQPPPRPVGFDLSHIPQYLPTAWYDTYFANVDSDARWLRRSVPVLLARMRLGGSARRAAVMLGLPWSAGRHAVATVAAQLRNRPAQQAAFDTALEALASQLHTAANRVDYGKRRDALAAWSLDPDHWWEMIRDRIGKPVNGKASRHIDWNDRKRLLASVWIWTRVTEGEMYFAPLLRPDPTQPKQGSDLSNYVHSRWSFITRSYGHYADLRPRLDAYSERLARQIDHLTPTDGGPVGLPSALDQLRPAGRCADLPDSATSACPARPMGLQDRDASDEQ